MVLPGSARIGNVASFFSAKAVLSSNVSVLAMK